jgi:3-dehydroquinate dehydratase II
VDATDISDLVSCKIIGKNADCIDGADGFAAISLKVMAGKRRYPPTCRANATTENSVTKILALHGINHNMFGKRDPAQYGTVTLEGIYASIEGLAKELGVEVENFQTNDEGAICLKIHQAFLDGIDAIMINAGAWTHYSYGLRDALAIFTGPIVEVHMSNVHAREEFRHLSVISPIVKGQIVGFGVDSYLLALRACVAMIEQAK